VCRPRNHSRCITRSGTMAWRRSSLRTRSADTSPAIRFAARTCTTAGSTGSRCTSNSGAPARLSQTLVAHGAELVARLPVGHVGRVRRFPRHPEAELRHLRPFRPVPVEIELVARLVIAMRAVVVRLLVAPRLALADHVVPGIDRHRGDADLAEAEVI